MNEVRAERFEQAVCVTDRRTAVAAVAESADDGFRDRFDRVSDRSESRLGAFEYTVPRSRDETHVFTGVRSEPLRIFGVGDYRVLEIGVTPAETADESDDELLDASDVSPRPDRYIDCDV
jgi:hypothetical protein